MAETYRYPVLIMESQSGLFTGCLFEEEHRAATGESPDAVLGQLKEYLTWQWQENPWQDEPDFLDPKVIDVQVPIRPEYRVGRDKVFPCSEMISIKAPCVHGRQSGGMFLGLLPTLGVRFHYYEKDALTNLAAHFAQATLAGKSPMELCQHLPLKSRVVEELVINVKGRSKRRMTKIWHEDEEIQNLAGIAEPLSARSVRGKYMRACQRDVQVEDLLARLKTKRASVLLVGDAGAGKTTILAEVARRLEREARRKKSRTPYAVWMTNAHRVIAGMRFLGQWEERCEKLISELSSVNGMLCFENLLDMVRTGGEGPLDSIASFLAPYVRRGELTLLAETTPAELGACRRLLPGFADLFQVLNVPSFGEKEARSVLSEMSGIVSQNSHVEAEAGVPEMICRLFSRFSPYAAFPGQAVDFLVRSFEDARDEKLKELSKQRVLDAFAKRTGLPEVFLRDEMTIDRDSVLGTFREQIIGQDRACSVAADLVTRFKAGMNDPGRPVGVLIFCGPTGVGKTALARHLSDYFFGHGDETNRLIRLDMSEYGTPGGAQRLVTGPDGGPSDLIKRIRRQPFSLVLLDEVEKAHPHVFDVLMNVFDEGRLTDPYGRVTTFRSSIIIMTSNLGASQQGSLGFGQQQPAYEEEVMGFFRPEFFNRIDAVVTFDPLEHDSILRIAEKELSEIPQREGLKAYRIKLNWTPALVEHVAQAGFDPRYGARPLQRTIEQDVVTPIARLLAEQPEVRETELLVDMRADGTVTVEFR